MPYTDKDKQREYQRKWRRKKLRSDPEYKKRQKLCKDRINERNLVACRQLVVEFRRNGCSYCAEKDPDCLCAHHKDPSKKKFTIGKWHSAKPTPERVKKELEKCICLCCNCHAKLHAKQRREKG